MRQTDFLKEAEVSSDLARKFLTLKGKLKGNEFEKITFEAVKIPQGSLKSISIPFLIAQTPVQIRDMNVGLFYGIQYDPRTDIKDSRTKIKTSFFGDVFPHNNKIKYFIVDPISVSHHSVKLTDKEIYKGFYKIHGTEGVIEEGKLIMRRVG